MDSFFAAMKPYKRKKSTSSAAGSEEQTEAEPSPFEALLTHPFAVPDLGKKWSKMTKNAVHFEALPNHSPFQI